MLITVDGIPVHPLLVHAVVVVVPLAAVVGAVAATMAKFAGDQLEAAIEITPGFAPVIAQHGRFGLYTVVASWIFAVVTVASVVLERRMTGPAPRIAAVLSALAGIAAIVCTVLAGHSGSAAVWGHVTQ